MHRAANNCAQVGWAGAKVSETLVMHELMSLLLHQVLDLSQTTSEAAEDLLHVATLLHGDDTNMILLINPDKEVLVIVVPYTTTVGPVTGASGSGEKSTGGLLKQEVVIDELFHDLVIHAKEGVVLASKVTTKTTKSIRDNSLYDAALGTGHGRGEAETTDRASTADTAGLDILSGEVTSIKLGMVKIRLGVLVSGAEVVDLLDHVVKELLECLVGVLIAEDTSGLLSVELVSWVVNTSLDALVKGHAVGGNFVPVLLVDWQSEMSSHDIIVFGKFGVCVFCGVFSALPWFVVAHAVFSKKFLDRHVA